MKKKINSSPFINKSDILYTYSSNKFYEDFVFQKEYFPYQFDSWKEKKNYGIFYKNRFVYPKNILYGAIQNNNNQLFNTLLFVADAFNDLKKYSSQFTLASKVSNQSSIYARLQVKSALKNFNDEYIDYSNAVYNSFQNIFLNQYKTNQINSFDDFIKFFVRFIRVLTNYSVFTRSGFLESNKCDLAVSGLIINLDDSLLFFESDQKDKKFISDPDFEAFVENAKRFGFYIDKNIPWRIVADLESPVMKDYYKKYGISSLDDLFYKHYHVAHYADLESNKNLIVAFWNKFVEFKKRSSQVKQVIDCKNLFIENTQLKKMSVDVFNLSFDINWQLRFQLYTKILESKVLIDQKTFDRICDETIKINQYYNTNSALDFITDKIIELQNMLQSDLLIF